MRFAGFIILAVLLWISDAHAGGMHEVGRSATVVADGADIARFDSTDAATRLARLSPFEMDEVVWLARCIYSESDEPHEQELVAWVVRNRVETGFRGRTYREVVLEAKQFSAFNRPSSRRQRILNLTPGSRAPGWQRALGIALDVYQSDAALRPFAQTVRHFYSPISMKHGLEPHWADSGDEISSVGLGVDPFRFRFFDRVSEGSSLTTRSSDRGSYFVDEILNLDNEVSSDNDGFLMPVMRPSGRVARPRRPTVQTARNPR